MRSCLLMNQEQLRPRKWQRQGTVASGGDCVSSHLTYQVCWRKGQEGRGEQRLFSLSQMRTRSVFHCGPRNEKQTRTLTDAEDCCEDVCIVLICGWSVDVLCQHPPRTVPFGTCPLNVNTHTKTPNCGLCTSGLNDLFPLSQIVQTRLLDDFSRRHRIKHVLLIGRKPASPHRTSRPGSAP